MAELKPAWPRAVVADFKAGLISYFTMCEKFCAKYGEVLTVIKKRGYTLPQDVPQDELLDILLEAEGVVDVVMTNN